LGSRAVGGSRPGDHTHDAGDIRLAGDAADVRDAAPSRALGIRLIFQNVSDAPTLSVAENVFLGDWPRSSGLVCYRNPSPTWTGACRGGHGRQGGGVVVSVRRKKVG
jgi:hypothetical protein